MGGGGTRHHHFLAEEDIQFYRRMLAEQYFDLVRLTCLRDERGRVLGFAAPPRIAWKCSSSTRHSTATAWGKALLRHAIEHDGVRLVDVNEQNPAPWPSTWPRANRSAVQRWMVPTGPSPASAAARVGCSVGALPQPARQQHLDQGQQQRGEQQQRV